MINFLKKSFLKIYHFPSLLNFKKKGKNIHLSLNGKIVRPKEIEMGSNIFISNGFHISARNLTFGNNIMIGPYLVIECDNHVFDKVGVSMFEISNERSISSVEIENDVWIGAHVTILPGVTICEGCIVGAGSVVTKSLPPYTIGVGIPCRPIKTRFSDVDMKKHLNLIKTSKYQIEEILRQWKLFNL